MYYLKTEQTFDSAHFLSGYDGKCKNLHGHTWKVTAHIRSRELNLSGQTRGMVVDFSELKRTLKDICEELDHCFIYEKGTLKAGTEQALIGEGFRLYRIDFRPTAENFARFFFDRLKEEGMPVYMIDVYETPKNCASYSEEESSNYACR